MKSPVLSFLGHPVYEIEISRMIVCDLFSVSAIN